MKESNEIDLLREFLTMWLLTFGSEPTNAWRDSEEYRTFMQTKVWKPDNNNSKLPSDLLDIYLTRRTGVVGISQAGLDFIKGENK